jgi:AbiA family abortive infection protein
MYDEVVNGRKHELGELFKGKMSSFLQGVQKATEKGITNKDYIELLDRNFGSDDIELAPMVVYNYFIYDDQTELKREENIEELSKIIERDNSFLALDTKRLSIMVMQSGNNELIKSMLYHLFIRYRAGLWNSFDTSVAIAYLIQSKFQHIDLLDIVRVVKPQLYSYSCNFCRTSFMFYLRYGNCEKWERYRIGMNRDCRAAFLYFMYLCEQNRHGHLASYAYYKSFFDRMSANMAFLSGKNKGAKKPDYNGYYKRKQLRPLYADVHDSKEIIDRAQDYRNKNPLIHASSQLLGNNSSSKELQEMEKKLDYLIDSYSKLHYSEWSNHLRQN